MSESKKDYILSMLIEQDIVDELKKVAKRYHRSMAAHIRWLVDKELRRHNVHPYPVEIQIPPEGGTVEPDVPQPLSGKTMLFHVNEEGNWEGQDVL